MKTSLIFTSLLAFLFFSSLTANAQDNITENKKINSLIHKKREYNKYNGFGYRIQLYYGNENKAKSLLTNFNEEFPDVYSKLGYDKPYWNVKVGSYRTRLDADRALNKIGEKFSGAIVVEK